MARQGSADVVHVGLKYCGGCQARYDRMAALQTVRSLCPPGTVFEPVEAGREYDYILIINGCQAQCADRRGLRSRNGMYSLFQFSDPAEAAAEIRCIRPGASGRDSEKSEVL